MAKGIKSPDAARGRCSRCGETEESKFTPLNFQKVGGWCRACKLAYGRAWREKQTGKPVTPRVRAVPGVCAKCGETDPSKFTPTGLRKTGQYCNPCQAAYRRGTNAEGRKRADVYREKERNKRIRWLREARAGGCVNCGEKDPACLDFHHVDEASKSFNIGSKIHTLSRAAIEAEIAKTIVICSNCHRKMHFYGRSGTYSGLLTGKPRRPRKVSITT